MTLKSQNIQKFTIPALTEKEKEAFIKIWATISIAQELLFKELRIITFGTYICILIYFILFVMDFIGPL